VAALADTLRELEAAFRTVGVRWYVFGAQAVAVHGAPRATQDLDVTVVLESRSRRELRDALMAGGFEDRFPEIAEELLRDGLVLPVRHVPSGFDIDVVIAGTPIEALAADRAERRNLAGVVVPVASATDVVIAKCIAGRPLDMQDVGALLACGRVSEQSVRETLSALERALGEDGFVARFEAEVARARPG
jgi:hypothetical protein